MCGVCGVRMVGRGGEANTSYVLCVCFGSFKTTNVYCGWCLDWLVLIQFVQPIGRCQEVE